MVYEDGLGWPDANSYATVEVTKTYFAYIKFDYSSYADAKIDAALIRATAFIDTYKRWPGKKATATQGLEWPRTDAYDVNGYLLQYVPDAIRSATMQAAIKELQEPFYFTKDAGEKVKREKIGDLEIEHTGQNSYPMIDQYLKKIVGYGGVRFER
jgi:hypothetical protein